MEKEFLRALLGLARWTLERWTAGETWWEGGPAPAPGDDRPVDGLFVTLRTQDGELRGCIGTVEPQESLFRSVRDFAVKTAGSDPRFPSVSADELPGLEISLSLLTPPQPLTSGEEVVVGRDGLIIELGDRRGLLLPEVPVEWGWDRERYLEELCRKASLPPGSWRDPSSRLFRFESVQISERKA